MLSSGTLRRVRTQVLVALLGTPLPLLAQEPAPSPLPPFQDELSLDARANVVLGSGARAFGMGGAFLARADDATAASWNPAGLSYLRRPEFSVVGARSAFSFRTRGPTATVDDRFRGVTPDFVSVAYPLDLGAALGSAQVSFQRVISFDISREIQRVGPRITIDSSGGFDVLAIGTGLRIARPVRVGFTLNRWFDGYTQTFVRTGGSNPTVEDKSFGISGWNMNLGLIATVRETINLGAVVKTGFTADIDLRQQRFHPPPRTPEFTAGPLRPVTLDLPGALGVGASWRPRSTLTLSMDYTRTGWSKAQIRNFFVVPASGAPSPERGSVFTAAAYPNLTYCPPRAATCTGRVQADTEQVRVGAEYVLIRGRVKIPLRVGYFNDRQYFRDVANRVPRFNGASLGAGVVAGRVLFDVAYVFEGGGYHESLATASNRVSLRAHRVYVSLIYRHPGGL